MKLEVVPIYAILFVLLYLYLSTVVIIGRRTHKVGLGHGDNKDMEKFVRIHGNFIENVPFALLLLTIMEINGAVNAHLHILGITLMIARLLHAWGVKLTRGASWQRAIGMGFTYIVMFSAAFYALAA